MIVNDKKKLIIILLIVNLAVMLTGFLVFIIGPRTWYDNNPLMWGRLIVLSLGYTLFTIFTIINVKTEYSNLTKIAILVQIIVYVILIIEDAVYMLIQYGIHYRYWTVLFMDTIITIILIIYIDNMYHNGLNRNLVVISIVSGIIAEIIVFAVMLATGFRIYLIINCISTIITLAALIILVYNSEFMDKQTYEIQKFNYVKEQLYQLKQMADANQIPQDIYELRKNQLLNSIM